MDLFPDIQFYDYTKIPNRIGLPKNYHLTWSYSAANNKYAWRAKEALDAGMNIAVVFRHKHPPYWHGVRVVDGDKDDLRFLDPRGVIVALKAKGKAKQDETGFVV